jgi:hypothetical protein
MLQFLGDCRRDYDVAENRLKELEQIEVIQCADRRRIAHHDHRFTSGLGKI